LLASNFGCDDIGEIMTSITKAFATGKVLRSLTVQQAWEKAIASMERSMGIEKALQSITQYERIWEKVVASARRQQSIQKAFDDIAMHQSAWEKVVASIQRQQQDIEKGLQLTAVHQRTYEKIVASLKKPQGIDRALQSISSHQTTWERVVASLQKPSVIEQAVNFVSKSSGAFLRSSNVLAQMAESVAQTNFDIAQEAANDIEGSFGEAIEHLLSANDSHMFLGLFNKLSPFLQAFIFFVLLHVFLPQINNIASNLITPHIESYLRESRLSDREKINAIKKMPRDLGELDTDLLRFITGNNVRLRKHPSVKSEILDELILGQVVTVISKKKNWIQVEYEYENGDVMTGWVFTRYTARFVRK
jgi:uncharacterized protein YgiM (DUF1202 family)